MNPALRILRLVILLWIVGGAWGGGARGAAPAEKAGVLPKDEANPMNEKESRTAAQKKLDSHIVLALKKSRREPPFDQPITLDPDLVIEADGRVLVDLKANVSGLLLTRIESAGGKVINSFEAAHAIRALVPLTQMEALAARDDVQFISPAAQAATNRGGAAQGGNIKP